MMLGEVTEETIDWGGLRLPTESTQNHFLVAGATGSGKTLTINLLMRSVIPDIRHGGEERALVYDPKNQALSDLWSAGAKWGQFHILNPFDNRCAPWAIGRDIHTPGHALELATILFPRESRNEPFWDDAASDLLSGAILGFQRKKPREWTLRDLLVATSHLQDLRAVLAWDEEQNSDRLERYFNSGRLSQSILTTLTVKTRDYRTVAACWHNAVEDPISLRDWVAAPDPKPPSTMGIDELARRVAGEGTPSKTARKEGDSEAATRRPRGGILVLGHSEEYFKTLQPINRVMFKRAAQLLLAQPDSETRKTWIFLDELGGAGRLDHLPDLLLKGRSRGVTLVIGFQDIMTIRETYGKEQAEALTAQVGNKAILKVSGPETAKWAERVFGDEEFIERMRNESLSAHGYSTGWSQHRTVTPVVRDSEFLALPKPSRREGRGVTGFFHVEGVGAYRHEIPSALLAGALQERKSEPPKNFDERPGEHHRLTRWDDKEREALNLAPLRPLPQDPPDADAGARLKEPPLELRPPLAE